MQDLATWKLISLFLGVGMFLAGGFSTVLWFFGKRYIDNIDDSVRMLRQDVSDLNEKVARLDERTNRPPKCDA